MEEALLRAGEGHWCLVNYGSPPAIVMGFSGTVNDVVHAPAIPVIRRFSGGGTVVVDEDTVFFSLILDGTALSFPANPVDVMRWVGMLVAPAFLPKTMVVEEQDYTIDGRKVGGNAQSFSRGRFVHHTSFLWSWDKERMALLNMPVRQPAYRRRRSHNDFCHKVSEFFPTKEDMIQALEQCLQPWFVCVSVSEDELGPTLQKPHRRTLRVESGM
jgi:lipoate-protein ligase A